MNVQPVCPTIYDAACELAKDPNRSAMYFEAASKANAEAMDAIERKIKEASRKKEEE